MGIHITAPNGLKGTKIHLEYPSVGATEQVLLTAVRAQGVTELVNAAVEPEIEDLIAVLQKMGAIISLQTDRNYHHRGVDGASAATSTSRSPTASRRAPGLRGAGHQGFRLRARRAAEADVHLPEHLSARSAG